LKTKGQTMPNPAPLFSAFIQDDLALQSALAKTNIAADLAVLVACAGVSRTGLAHRLGWSKARVSQVLGGKGNLTVETIHAVAHAVGHRFHGVFLPMEGSAALKASLPNPPQSPKVPSASKRGARPLTHGHTVHVARGHARSGGR
jgi:DNA-binding phage protein